MTSGDGDRDAAAAAVDGASLEFYRRNCRRYAEVAHTFAQSVYHNASHAALTDDFVLLSRALSLAPGLRCLDAGCGAGARDVYALWQQGCDAWGVDAVAENVALARELHPEIADRVLVADLTRPLPFEDERFALVLCNAVLQHIPTEQVVAVTLPELVRVLQPSGILQLMFKHGAGALTLFDADYGECRTFLLHDEHTLLPRLLSLGMALVEQDAATGLGGVMYFTDPKEAGHCVFHVRKLRHS